MLTRVADWSSIVGAVLGTAGMLFSILAFWAANRAKQSAEQARKDKTVDHSVVISLEMEDQGEKQEIAVSSDLPTTAEEEQISDMVEELYRLARHQTLKIDGKIDEVLALLDRA